MHDVQIISPEELLNMKDFVVLMPFLRGWQRLEEITAQCEELGIEWYFNDMLFYLLYSKKNGNNEKIDKMVYTLWVEKRDKNFLLLPIMGTRDITTRCTLKCRDCVSRIPYARVHKDEDLDVILKEVNRAFELIDATKIIEPIGGETLLYKRLPELLRE